MKRRSRPRPSRNATAPVPCRQRPADLRTAPRPVVGVAEAEALPAPSQARPFTSPQPHTVTDRGGRQAPAPDPQQDAGYEPLASPFRVRCHVSEAENDSASELETASRTPDDPDTLMTLIEARDELGLSIDEFDTAVQAGEVWTVHVADEESGTPRLMVSRAALRRLKDEQGFPVDLRERLHLVGTVTGAELLGITRDRFVRLAKAGCFRPARWYFNRYRAVVWLYPAYEVLAFALDNPDWLQGRLPQAVREALAGGLDRRAAGWRTRRTGLLARHAPDAWHEAAAWYALLGQDEAADLLPDAAAAGRLSEARPASPVVRHGRRAEKVAPSLVPGIADDLIEIAHARLRMTVALERAQKAAEPTSPVQRDAGPRERLAPHPGVPKPSGARRVATATGVRSVRCPGPAAGTATVRPHAGALPEDREPVLVRPPADATATTPQADGSSPRAKNRTSGVQRRVRRLRALARRTRRSSHAPAGPGERSQPGGSARPERRIMRVLRRTRRAEMPGERE